MQAGIDPDLAAFFIETQFVTVINLVVAGEPLDHIRAQALLVFECLLNR